MTSPDTTTAPPAKTTGDVPAPAPAPAAKPSPSSPVLASTLKAPAVGTLVTDAELESETDARGVTKLVTDAAGDHFVVGAGSSIGVVVSVDPNGIPSVAWLPDAGPYGLPLLPLIGS